MSVVERLGLEHPVVAAGMGGGLSRAPLTAAVADAGGLGQLGILPPPLLARELAAHRERSAGPVAINLLLPFATPAHWEVARRADAVVTFWGRPRRRTDGLWVHQCGSVAEADEAAREGADAVIVQGVEAGGHVRGTTPLLELLARVRAGLPAGVAVWAAGGVAEAADVRRALDAGAEAVVAGTRFLLSQESSAHPAYKDRLLEAGTTVLTDLFGLGWPAPHRVVPNAATARWLGTGGTTPAWVRGLHRATSPALARAPMAVAMRLARTQRPGLPLLGPTAPVAGGPAGLVDAGPLYAGESVARIHDLRPAGDLVHELAGTRGG